MKWFGLGLALALTLASLVLCQRIISNSIANQENKYIYAELNHVKYGLLNVDEWKRQVTGIVSEEIDKLNLNKAGERDLRKHLEVLLDALIDKLAQRVKEGNATSVEGWVKQAFIDIFVSLKDIKKGIPDYANTIIHEIKKSKTRKQIKNLLHQQLEQYSKQIYEPQDTAALNRVLQATGSKTIEEARLKVDQAIAGKQKLIWRDSLWLILGTVILFSLSGFSREPLSPPRYLLLVFSLVLLLVVGVTTPTIDLDARISQLSFMVLGHPIRFENQVLYFQTKSLLDVFRIMIADKDLQMKLVGVLLITFSIIFPVLKIFSSVVYYFNFHKARENPGIRFFVLYSGKWSMADVMVVAIFMAYIGFNGMVTGMFGQLRAAGGPDLVMITTNGTALQPGYYVFLTYTLLALFLTGFLSKKVLA